MSEARNDSGALDGGEFVLVETRLPDNQTFYDLYTLEGKYFDTEDSAVRKLLINKILASGARIWQADEWVAECRSFEYRSLWTHHREDVLLVDYGETSTGRHFDVYTRDGVWVPIPDAQVHSRVIERMRASGVQETTIGHWEAELKKLRLQSRQQDLKCFEPLWTVDKLESVLIEYRFLLSGPFLWPASRNGERFSISDDELRTAVVARMVDAGIEVISEEEWNEVLVKRMRGIDVSIPPEPDASE